MRARVGFGLAVIAGVVAAMVAPGRSPSLGWGLAGALVGFAVGALRPRWPAFPAVVTALLLLGGLAAFSGQAGVGLPIGAAGVATVALWMGSTWLWRGASSDARDGSAVSRVERGRVEFRAGAVVALLGALWLTSARAFGGLLFGLACATLAVTWTIGALQVRILTRWARRAVRVEDEAPVRAGNVDLGVGAGQWLLEERADHPYRAGRAGSLVLQGDLPEAVDRLVTMTLARTPVLVLMGVLVVLVPRHRPRSFDEGPPPRPVAQKSVTTPARSGDGPSLGWYPQPGPILADLTADGVDDIVGLRWDWDKEEAALSVVATDGRTFRRIWSTESRPAKWYSPSIHLVRSGSALFLTDSEGNLFVHDLATGAQRAWASVGPTEDFCASPDAEEVWGQPRDREGDDLGGTLFTATGSRSLVDRPSWCPRSWRVDDCPRADGSACVPSARPPWLRDNFAVHTIREQDDLGVVLAFPPKERQRDAVPPLLLGYDPKGGKKRFEARLPFTDDEIHTEPDLAVGVAAGRLVAYYQLKSGAWLLGARDARTGDRLWHRNPPRAEHGTHFGSMTAAKDRLYVRLNTRLEVFDATNGDSLGVVW